MIMLNSYLREKFGCKVYKLALCSGCTCPNRDGTLGSRGCIFCSGKGSGEFAESADLPVSVQIERAKSRVSAKIKNGKYIAYFQSFTNTYAQADYLRGIFSEAIASDDIVALSIATRPDCLPDDIIKLLDELNRIKPVWVELGLQTIHERTARYIRRGYPLSVYDDAVKRLRAIGVEVITHMIIGLPHETPEETAATAKYISDSGVNGIKLQLLHVLEGTDLADEYRSGKFNTLTLYEYIAILRECLLNLRQDMVVHRLTGDGAKKDLIAPFWSADKKKVLAEINRQLKDIIHDCKS